METRTVWRIDRSGSLDRLKLRSELLSEPATNEVQLRVKAVGLNFADLFACQGLYSATPKGSFIPGLEVSGVVEKIGKRSPGISAGETEWGAQAQIAPGAHVTGFTRFGGFASRINLNSEHVLPIPTGWTFEEGAALGVQPLTAWYAIEELGGVSSGATVLLHSAAGGVGLSALRILARKHATVVATVGTPDKAEFLAESLGLPRERIIVRSRRLFPSQLDRVLEVAGKRTFDLVLDSVAGPFFGPGYRRMGPRGRYVLFGSADMMTGGKRPNYLALVWKYLRRPRIDPLQMIAENRSVMAFNLIWLWEDTELLRRIFLRMMREIPDRPFVGRVFPFDRAPGALRFLQSGRSIGKVVLTLDE